MTTVEPTIVEYEPTYRQEVDQFWTSILGRAWNRAARRRWQWLNDRRKHYLALMDGRIAGSATLLSQQFTAGSTSDSTVEVGWITDFYVRPEVKGHGLGRRLTQRLMEASPNLASFGQSPDARRCFARLVWTEPRWIALLGRLVPWVPSRNTVFFRTEECPFDDPRLDEVWKGRRDGLLGTRDRRALAARFLGRPDTTYRIYLASGADGPLGWIVTRRIRERWNRRFGPVPTGLIVDLLAVGDRQDVLTALVLHSMDRLAREGAVLALAVATSGSAGEALRRAGFDSQIRGFGVPLRRLPAKGFVASPSAAPLFLDLPPLSFADCDAELTF